MRNDGYEFTERIGRLGAGRAVLDYLVERYPHSTVDEWRERIADGRVRVDRSPVRSGTRLTPGQRLSWHRPGWIEPPAPATYAVLHRDDDLLGVAKPAGLPVLPGAGYVRSTLLTLVRRTDPDASPVHRLGRGTSGVVLFARTRRARAELCRQWSARQVGKRYRALARGAPTRDTFSVDVPIGPIPYGPIGTVHAASRDGKPASSHVTVLARREGCFVCDVRIETGRPHQIRIHLAAAGHPLLGDPLFGDDGLPHRDGSALPGDVGYRLHAAELTIRHPAGGALVSIECAPPPVLRVR